MRISDWSSDVCSSDLNRTRSADVHEAASDTVKTLYESKLAQPTPEGLDRAVLFTAGGTGAGKTTAVNAAGDAFGKPEIRSEERRVGKVCVSQCRSRCSAYP